MKKNIALIHTSPAAIPPVTDYYHAHAPEMELTNLLDDGLLRWFAAGELTKVESRLRDMIRTARESHCADCALLTCSSVPLAMMENLRAPAEIPVIRIDEPMARQAISSGKRIGLLATFQPTVKTTSELLRSQAEAAGKRIEVRTEIAAGAFQALLAGDPAEHDRLLVEAAARLDSEQVDVIVLAQVSMSRAAQNVRQCVQAAVIGSLDTSLEALRTTSCDR